MKNFVQEGDVVTVATPVGGVSSGDGLLIGALFGVSAADAAAGDPVALATVGVFSLPKASAAAFTQGAPVSWDGTAKECVAAASGKYPVGVAVEPAGARTATVIVRLNGVATAAAA